MNVSPTLRWGFYGVALALAIGATLWVERDNEDAAVVSIAHAQQASPETPTGSPADTTTDETRKHGALGIDALPTRSYNGANTDPFSPRSWKQMAADAARRDAPPRPPPVPQPPPLPFSYMGKLVEGKVTTVFLTDDEQNYIARLGDTIEDDYRVEAIGENGMTLTYLPLKRRQQLAFDADTAPRSKSTPRTRSTNGDDNDMQRTDEFSEAKQQPVTRDVGGQRTDEDDER
jgi:hypothetical protein